MTTSSKVSIGPSSALGWLAAAGGIVTSTVQSLEHSQALASGPGKWPAILGVLALVATNAMRQFQAAHLASAARVAAILAHGSAFAEQELPTAEEELSAPPDAPLAPPVAPLPPPVGG